MSWGYKLTRYYVDVLRDGEWHQVATCQGAGQAKRAMKRRWAKGDHVRFRVEPGDEPRRDDRQLVLFGGVSL